MPKVRKDSYSEKTDEYDYEIRMGIARKNLTQKDIAKRLKKDRSTVSKYLSNIDNMNFGTLRSLASFLGLEIVIREKGSRNDI